MNPLATGAAKGIKPTTVDYPDAGQRRRFMSRGPVSGSDNAAAGALVRLNGRRQLAGARSPRLASA